MSSTYTLTVTTDFAASHIIPGHPGKCARLHGHNWKVEVYLKATQLNDLGMALDFADLKQATKAVIDEVDHQHLNEIPPFNEISPTAENISRWLFQRIGEKINTERAKISAVTLWETDRCCVSYSE